MRDDLPNAKSARSPVDREKIKRVVVERGLCGLANDTKWNEFVHAVRDREEWRPSYRCKCVDGPPSAWDVDWFYHLPFPLISVEWIDVAFFQETRSPRLASPAVVDHSTWIEGILKQVGLDYLKGKTMIRIFGYSPRSKELFEE